MKVINVTKQSVLGDRLKHANTFWPRLRGLLGRTTLGDNEGIVLEPCNAVHGWGMKFSCDVIYLSAEGKVLHVQTLHPGTRGPFLRKAFRVVEVPVGVIGGSRTEPGDLLEIVPNTKQIP